MLDEKRGVEARSNQRTCSNPHLCPFDLDVLGVLGVLGLPTGDEAGSPSSP
jgi:hypothetical protein